MSRRTWRPSITNIEACPGPQCQAGSIHTTQAMLYFRLPSIVFLAFQVKVSQKTEKEIVGHYNTCDAAVWRFRVSTVAMAMHQCVLCVLLSYTSLARIYKHCVAYSTFTANLYRQQQGRYLGHHVKCPIFLYGFNQIRSSPKDIHKSSQYQISRKSIQWDPRWYRRTETRTDGRTWRSQLAPFATMRTGLQVDINCMK
jgi:hypothetical protein